MSQLNPWKIFLIAPHLFQKYTAWKKLIFDQWTLSAQLHCLRIHCQWNGSEKILQQKVKLPHGKFLLNLVIDPWMWTCFGEHTKNAILPLHLILVFFFVSVYFCFLFNSFLFFFVYFLSMAPSVQWLLNAFCLFLCPCCCCCCHCFTAEAWQGVGGAPAEAKRFKFISKLWRIIIFFTHLFKDLFCFTAEAWQGWVMHLPKQKSKFKNLNSISSLPNEIFTRLYKCFIMWEKKHMGFRKCWTGCRENGEQCRKVKDNFSQLCPIAMHWEHKRFFFQLCPNVEFKSIFPTLSNGELKGFFSSTVSKPELKRVFPTLV